MKHSETPPVVGGAGIWVQGVRESREMMTLHQGLRGQRCQVQNRKEGAAGALGMLSWECTGASWGVQEQCHPPSYTKSVQM